MDWDDYRHLLALARTGNLTAAADRLGVVRTTVGRRLAAAEAALGVLLFERTPDGYVPTPAGADLVSTAEAVEAEMLASEARVLGRDAALIGALRVSTLDFLVEAHLDMFSSFAERYPGIELTVCAGVGLASLRRREADVVLRMSDAPDPHLVGRRLRHLQFVPCASRALVERVGLDAPLSAYPWLSDDPRNTYASSDHWLDALVPEARVVMRFDHYFTIRAAVRAGIGAHMLWEGELERDPSLLALPTPAPPPRPSLWVLTLDELKSNSRVRAFMDHAWEHLGVR